MVIIKHISTLIIQLHISFSDDHTIQYHVKIALCLLNCLNLAHNNNYNDLSLCLLANNADAALGVDLVLHCYSRNSRGLIIP